MIRTAGTVPALLRFIRSSAVARYGAAGVATVLGILARVALMPLLGPQLPYVTLFPAIMVSAWLGGFGPGLLSTALSSIAAMYLWLEPASPWGVAPPGGLVGLALFWIVCLAISGLNEASRRAVNAVARAEERLRTTLFGIGDAVIATDATGRVTQINPIAESLTGWRAEDALGRPVSEVFVILDEATRRPAENPVSRAIADGRVAALANHTMLVARDGRETPVDDSATPIRDADGAIAGAVLIFRDVSERRRVERERAALLAQEQAARREAASAEHQLRMALEAGRMGTWEWTIATGAVRWSPGLEAIHGLRPGTFAGTFEAVQREVHPEDRAQVARAVADAVEGGAAFRVDYRIVRADGAIRWVEGIGQVFRDGEGRPALMVGVCSDVTERKQGEEVLREADRRKDEFLAVLSHELRNPINAVVGWAQILRAGGLPPDKVRHGLEVIERNARAEAQLVESLLDVSRISVGKLDLEMKVLDVAAVATAAVENARPVARAKGVGLDLETGSEVLAIDGDLARLDQVFTNLLSNAVKFTPAGGRVRILLDRLDTRARVRVVDDGEGIAPAFLPFVFDRFRQADGRRERQHGGLGLGLAVVRELVHAHGGTVEAESAGIGRGSTFAVVLPLRAAATARDGGTDTANESGPPIRGLRILVVDDDADARDLLAVTLEAHGATVVKAVSAADGLACIAQDHIDVLVADIGMRDEDGYAFLLKVRGREREHNLVRLPAVAVTAYAAASDREQAFRAGFDLHLAKPVDTNALLRAVARLGVAARL